MINKRRTLGTIAGHQVIATIGGALILHGSNRDCKGVISGGGNRCLALRTHAVIAAVIASSHNYNNPCIPGFLHCLAKWIERIAFKHLPAQ